MSKPDQPEHPASSLLRVERFPHIWCSTCSIGTMVQCLANAIQKSGIEEDKIAVVSGIGCAGRVAGYVRFDSFHATHGRAIPFATGLKLARPELRVMVVSGDGDLAAIGGNHLIHAARRNMDLAVVCSNNFIYGMTGGQVGPTTPESALTTTTPFGNFEPPFNLPHLVASSGASYVARWTALHVRRLTQSLVEAITKPGFNFVEVITACPVLYNRRNKLGDGLDAMRFYRDRSVIRHGARTEEVDIPFDGPIVVGKFA
jgi:2-oxoglutarate ferredoxin oxidoreductase subunit beta